MAGVSVQATRCAARTQGLTGSRGGVCGVQDGSYSRGGGWGHAGGF